MLEPTLGRDLVAALEGFAAGNGLARVRAAHVAIDTVQPINVEALRLWFEMAAAPGSAAEGAELCLEDRLAEASCLNCGAEVEIRRRSDACPACGSFRLRVRSSPTFWLLGCDGD